MLRYQVGIPGTGIYLLGNGGCHMMTLVVPNGNYLLLTILSV